MVVVERGMTPDQWSRHETYYQTQYATWNGFVSRISLLRQIIDIRAASVINSWETSGPHDGQAAKMLSDMEGRGSETFEEIIANMYKIAYICGDAYAEKIYDDDMIADLQILPSDNIRQVIQKGEIKRYEEIDGNAKWGRTEDKDEDTSYKIFHLAYGRRGATTHGHGMIEAMNNLLLSYEQMLQLGQETYERQGKSRIIIFSTTDNEAKLGIIRTAVKEAGAAFDGVAVVPRGLVEKEMMEIKFTPSLKPQEWMDTISKEIFKSTATPELILGTGYSTSEEDAKTRIGGFRQSIGYDQNWLELNLRKQIFAENWPTNPPEINFSFATESEDEAFLRNMSVLPVIEQSQVMAPENKSMIIKEKLKEMGMIQ